MSENHRIDRAGETAGGASHRWRQAEREGADRARQAAEALFRPPRPVAPPLPPDPAPAADPAPEPAARNPRVLQATLPASPRQVEEPAPPRRHIPAAHVARIRAWLEYGMTVRQAAEVYGVAASDIERLVRQA